MRLNGQIKNPVFNAGTTYIVEENVTFSLSVIIPENVTLIFQGGKFVVAEDCTEEITISGTNTRLVAPICTIFGKGINVVGSWNIDRAYPQWFEIEKAINSCDSIEPYDDWSTPINKAIKMKQVGEVFLRNEEYSIASPIIMNCRIQLVGESSQWKDVTEENNESIYGCTRIFPVAEGIETFVYEYMLYVNAETDTELPVPGMEYIERSTLIKNIFFSNWIEKGPNEILKQKCILAGGGVHLDNLSWNNFLQAVKYTDTYNDGKCVTNCVFSTDPHDYDNNEEYKEVYAFDMGFLGDALKFERNGIAVTANGKALRLSNCGGASIQGNIINGNILIEQSKAIVFNANHCENGIQIEIIDSCVSTQNNFIWKGKEQTYLIHSSGNGDKSVVSLKNDMFIVNNDILDDNNNISFLESQINDLAEYDIALDSDTILSIENVFRYDVGRYGFGKMYPFGISLCSYKLSVDKETGKIKKEFENLEEINKYSYITSYKCSILSGFEIQMQRTIKQLNTPEVYSMMLNEGVFWFGGCGRYRYFYQIVWDKNRGIKKTNSSISTSNSIYNINRYKRTDNQEFISYDFIEPSTNKGVLLVMGEDVNGNCAMVRLIREKTTDNSFQEVYVPVCGSRYLYDNGISVCGYKWKPYDTSILFEPCDKNMEMLRINNGNVECYTKREDGITPTSGWKRGDVIHNISNSNPSTYIVPDDIA